MTRHPCLVSLLIGSLSPLAHAADATVDPALPPACSAGNNAWLASNPRVPLAIVDDQSIASPDASCCAAWKSPDTPWQGIDAWGQSLNIARVTGDHEYDASQCWELTLTPNNDNGRAALYVSGDWTPSPSFEWQPSPQQHAEFTAFVAALRILTVSPEYHQADYTKRRDPQPAFFELPKSDDAHNVHPTKFAAMGGSTFALAYIASDGTWKLGTLLNDTAIPVGPVDTYDIVAIVDMNADGLPEVVVHTDEGPAWNDVVLTLHNPYQRYAWSITATSVLGGTM
ncbi:MAG: hypothetical protein AB8H79_19670 [Myxococcota bacterium]